MFSLPWLIAKNHGLFEAAGIDTDESAEDTYHWMARWGLISGAACAADLVDNRLSEAATTPADD